MGVPRDDCDRLLRARLCALALVLLIGCGLIGCGYTLGAKSGAVRLVSVPPVVENGIDVDAAAYVNTALREAVARSTSARLVGESASEASLEVTMLGTDSPLLAFADPGQRAAQYRAVVSLRARLISRTGAVLWTSEVITGESAYLSPSGRIEMLDGIRRTALSRAAEDAAVRLVASMNAAL